MAHPPANPTSTHSADQFDLEHKIFADLQTRLPEIYSSFGDRAAQQTVLIVPSLSLDAEVLAKVSGVHHYEERLLCLLILLRLPRVNIVFVTSQPIHDSIIDYYLHLLPGIPSKHARKRLTLLNCQDASPAPLTQKILDRPRLLERIRSAVVNPLASHITCFNATHLERKLAVALKLPLYACDPDRIHYGSKSDGREIFRTAGVDIPDGIEHLHNEAQLVKALTEMKLRNPDLKRAVIKLNEGFSGEGNALFEYDTENPPKTPQELEDWIAAQLSQRIRFEAADMTWDLYREKLERMGGIVECWIEGTEKRSPSVQCRIDPLGKVSVISTHDQMLGGPSGQIYLGCTFPADERYRLEIQEAGLKIAHALKEKGVLGIWGVDFVSVQSGAQWTHYAIEINIRKGGTTFPFLVLQFLTDGSYDTESGVYRLPDGQPRCYYASDNLQKPRYRGLSPDDLIDIMVYHQLHFDSTAQKGVVFHLMGALSEFGKFGVTCIGENQAQAEEFYQKTMRILDQETSQ
ncbi:MAG: ATP-grasp domain-containing protein [Phycisphaerales bacterium]|nr:ATP-grasp domain-containing protein [Phycisphaerales bacterium]